LKQSGWNVELMRGECGYSIILGRSGSSENTATGENARIALEDLIRNLTQLGELPKELREMLHRVQQQIEPIHQSIVDAVTASLEEAFGTN
jgi:hypothetical protein